ncbi:hypothetical protein BDN71DRAFT_1392626, partial [Pleurotus eryngii]
WVGCDDSSKGHWVYWPDTHRVSVECNIYFDESAANSQVEGENSVEGEIPAVINSESTQIHSQSRCHTKLS